jgi:VanZ family protein
MNRSRSSFWLLAARVALAACALITVGTAFAPEHGPKLHLFPWDKAEHFSAFFGLTACAILAFPRTPLLWIGASLSGCGALIEVIQGLPWVHRDCDVMDWVADTVAICAVMGVIFAARLRREIR